MCGKCGKFHHFHEFGGARLADVPVLCLSRTLLDIFGHCEAIVGGTMLLPTHCEREIGKAFDVLATCLSQLSCYKSIIAIPWLFCHLQGLWLMFTSHLVASFNPIRGYLTLAVTRIKPNRETGGTEVGPYGSSTYAPLKCAPPAFQSLSFTQFYLKTTNLIITFNIW